jgi:REP element-mobilizing transposase RayT
MELILWSALGVAQSFYPLKVISFVVMGNHIHIIALVEDPTTVEGFMERFKCETAHAINRLLGRRQVTVWCEGYDSPTILTLDDLIEKLAYVYANPVRAHRTSSISRYRGQSSWAMFTSGEVTREVKRIRRTFLAPIMQGRVSVSERIHEASVVERQAKEVLSFTLSPDAWMIAFPGQSTPAAINEKLLKRLKEIESEMAIVRERDLITLPSETAEATQPIDTPYVPETFGRRMWCICRDVALKVAFISLIKSLREKARKVRLQWLQGNTSEVFPPGLFPTSYPILANLPSGYLRRSLALS